MTRPMTQTCRSHFHCKLTDLRYNVFVFDNNSQFLTITPFKCNIFPILLKKRTNMIWTQGVS